MVNPFDPRYVTYGGRSMLRVIGGESEEALPEGNTPEPAPEAPQVDTQPEQGIDWERRYKDEQAALTRFQQEAADYRKKYEAFYNPETQREALQELGLDFEDEEEELGEYEDPYESVQREVAELKSWREQREQQETQAQREAFLNDYINAEIDKIEADVGELPPRVQQWIGNQAAINLDEDGRPDVLGTWQEFEEMRKEDQKRMVSRRRKAARAPAGGPGTETVNNNDAQSRQRAMAQAIEEGSDEE